MKKQLVALSLILIISGPVAAAKDADEKPYTEGPVTEVSFIRVKDGKFMEYLSYLDSTWKAEHEAEKKAGLITEFHVYGASPQSPEEANVILTVTYPNYAALDKTAEFDAVAVKVEGSLKAADKGFADRGSMRTVLGTQLVREMILK